MHHHKYAMTSLLQQYHPDLTAIADNVDLTRPSGIMSDSSSSDSSSSSSESESADSSSDSHTDSSPQAKKR